MPDQVPVPQIKRPSDTLWLIGLGGALALGIAKIYERNLGELERIASDLMALQEHLANYGDAHG